MRTKETKNILLEEKVFFRMSVLQMLTKLQKNSFEASSSFFSKVANIKPATLLKSNSLTEILHGF